MKGLIEKLVEVGELSKQQKEELNKKIEKEGLTEEEAILKATDFKEEDLFELKSELTGTPLKTDVNLDKLGSILPEMSDLIPKDSAEHYNLVPLGKTQEGEVNIGMVYPKDLKAREALRFLAERGNFPYNVYLITPSVFEDILKEYKKLRKGAGAALGALEEEREEELEKMDEEEIEELKGSGEATEDMAEEAPIIRVVSTILEEAVEAGASDIHIEPSQNSLEVRYRIDGVLHSTMTLPKEIHRAVIARVKILSDLQIEEKRRPQDGRFFSRFGSKVIDFRVALMPTTEGEKAVLRLLDSEEGLMKVSELGMRPKIEEKVKKGVQKPTGMVLATGPTGSGKTTTLYSLLRTLNTEDVNITTLEDPVEYQIKGVNQSQVNHEIGYDFANGLRQILRQDPDIIMVGEIRDEETANLAVHAALTGHIVLSTLHTNNAVGVVPRLTDMGVEPYLVSPTLNLAIAQRLVRRLCPHCKKKTTPDSQTEEIIREEIEQIPESSPLKDKVDLTDITTYEPGGCDECGGIGFSGRIGIFEVLEMSDELSRIILEDPTEEKLNKQARKQGLVTMRQDGLTKALNGHTSVKVILNATKETR